MKTYNQFLNENTARGDLNNKLPIGFRFAIDFSSEETLLGNEKLKLLMEEMKKYFYFNLRVLLLADPNLRYIYGLEASLASPVTKYKC